ncbi:hypothetical protein ACLMJK_006817 [Lecanora helva]
MVASTPQRRSLGRPRPSLGLATHSNKSSTNLSSAYIASQNRPPLPSAQSSTSANVIRKTSLSQQPPNDISSTVLDNQEHTQAPEPGSSPFTMYPSRPANGGTATDDKNSNQNLEVGALVDVPGGMHGTIKFIGEVKGKKGHFAGVELSKEFAARGKNDGDVDGVRYFTTSIRGAGIFLPSNKAYKRVSPSFSSDSMPPTPDTPNLGSSYMGTKAKEHKVYTPTSSSALRLAQSVGPGRTRSPDLKPKSRPSLPRPESPLRKGTNVISTPAGRPSVGAPKLSKSVIGGSRYAPSPTPTKFGASVNGGATGDKAKRTMNVNKPTPRTPDGTRPQSRSNSRLGPEAMFDEDSDNTPIGVARAKPINGAQQRLAVSSNENDEVKELKKMLELRDQQLEKQTSDLEEMQASLVELQAVTSKHDSAGTSRSRGSGIDDLDAPALRAMLRKRDEKIATLNADFDDHRAQFRSTIDSLERTSDETNRIYEQQVIDLRKEIADLENKGDDVESVAQQLKQLEELVQELEEGLEDARRGEAEARGEVEYLRGEVERTQSEIQREREKAAAALKGAGVSIDGATNSSGFSKEIEQKDDEIRGLKAIIHSLSRDQMPEMNSPRSGSRRVSRRHSNQANGHTNSQIFEERQTREKLEREIKDLEGLVDRKTYREEELEHEIQRLRKGSTNASSISNDYSERTSVPNSNNRPDLSKGSLHDWRDHHSSTKRPVSNLESMPESEHSTSMTDSSSMYCEMCETFGHELFSCPKIDHNGSEQAEQRHEHTPQSAEIGAREKAKSLAMSPTHTKDHPPVLSPPRSPVATPKAKMPNPMDQGPVAGKGSRVIELEKWCALCERDGHESVDCPFEDIY